MAQALQYDLIIIGAGPAGEVGAIRAAQLGMKTALIDKREHLGGTCLNVGCIPTKALLNAAKTWDKLQNLDKQGFHIGKPEYDWHKILGRKDKIVQQMRKGLQFLMKKNKVDVYQGFGKVLSTGKVEVTPEAGAKTILTAENILLATGSKVRELPFAKTNGKNILSSDHILSIDSIPKNLVIIGGGVVGMEFASLFGRMGTQVTVVEAMEQILPFEDGEVVKEAIKHFKKQNITLLTATKTTSIKDLGEHCEVGLEGKDALKAEKVLVSIGRSPVTEGLGLENVGIKPKERGTLEVDEHYRTKAPGIYAVGDILDTPALAHTASAEAMHAVEVMAGHNPPLINYDANPSAIYSYPEIAHVGSTEEEVIKKGIDYGSAKFPFSALAKANIEDATVGFVKILFDKKYREILGAHIIGATATEMIAEFGLGKILESTVDEIAHTIHPHPTLSETVMEAAHSALGAAIHM